MRAQILRVEARVARGGVTETAAAPIETPPLIANRIGPAPSGSVPASTDVGFSARGTVGEPIREGMALTVIGLISAALAWLAGELLHVAAR